MKLNRTRALFLVGTIAAVGCVVENSDDDGGGGDDNEAGAGGSAGSAGTAGSATGGKGGSANGGSAGTYTGGTSGTAGDGGATCLGDDRDPQVTCADFMGAGGEGYGGRGGAGPTCDQTTDLQADYCTELWTNLKPAVANDARTCMNAQTPEEVCSWAVTWSCAQEAILAACPDETADDECETIHTDCAGIADIPVSECSLVLSGMTQAGRDAVVACEYCDLWFCAAGVEE